MLTVMGIKLGLFHSIAASYRYGRMAQLKRMIKAGVDSRADLRIYELR